VFIATSLDGFIARRDGALDWLTGGEATGEDYGYKAFEDSVDGLVMGRGTYETVLGFDDWPYPKPVVVLGRSLAPGDLPDRLSGRVSFSTESPTQVMNRLAAEGWRRAYVDGGRVIQSFVRAGLIADMVISRLPVLLGDGLPLFGPLDRDIHLRLDETRRYPGGMVQSRYTVLPGQ
jgi:dihydrofolate reductase